MNDPTAGCLKTVQWLDELLGAVARDPDGVAYLGDAACLGGRHPLTWQEAAQIRQTLLESLPPDAVVDHRKSQADFFAGARAINAEVAGWPKWKLAGFTSLP